MKRRISYLWSGHWWCRLVGHCLTAYPVPRGGGLHDFECLRCHRVISFAPWESREDDR